MINIALVRLGSFYRIEICAMNVDVYNGTDLIDKVKVGVGEVVDEDGNEFVGGEDE